MVSKSLIMPDTAAPPGYHYHCPLCGADLHFIGPWYCYSCGTVWELDDLLEAIEYDEREDSNVG